MSDEIKTSISIKNITYNGQYNTQFRPITNTPITTVEVSPTGSGKTYFYKDSPNTIMLMPTNTLVKDHNGLVSSNNNEFDENGTTKYRTEWNELDLTKCEYMTYDKFAGHIKYEDISNLNIIIDEAHNLLSAQTEIHKELIMKLLYRKKKYKELKLISATLRAEIFEFFKGVSFDIQGYQKANYKPHINFVYQFPKIDHTQRTLIFINSEEKMYTIAEYCNKNYPEMNILILKSKVSVPTKEEMEKYNLILSTSVIKEGYSIENKIDKLIIFNKFHACGAKEILQYMARPRNQTPDTYVVMADTHFITSNGPKYKDHLDLIEAIHKEIENKGRPKEANEWDKEAFTLYYQNFVRTISSIDYHNDPAKSCYLYDEILKNSELYYDNGEFMKMSIMVFIPTATIKIIKSLDTKDIEDIKFTKLDISEYKYLIQTTCKSQQEVIDKVEEMLVEVSKDVHLSDKEQKTISKKLKDIQKIQPYKTFKIDDKVYKYTDDIIVRQMIDLKVFNKCKWHEYNLKNNIYKSIKSNTKSNERLRVGDTQKVSYIIRKFKRYVFDLNFTKDILEKKKKLSKDDKIIMSIKLLERIYSFEKYRNDDTLVTASQSIQVDYVIIRSLYTVYDSWYNLEFNPGRSFQKTLLKPLNKVFTAFNFY